MRRKRKANEVDPLRRVSNGSCMAPGNDNERGLRWSLRGPDADDAVWLDFDTAGCLLSFDLGPKEHVHAAFADTLSGIDYGAMREEPIWGGLPWELRPPAGDDRWQLRWRGEGGPDTLVLGSSEQVADAFIHWLTQQDWEERG